MLINFTRPACELLYFYLDAIYVDAKDAYFRPILILVYFFLKDPRGTDGLTYVDLRNVLYNDYECVLHRAFSHFEYGDVLISE